MYIAASFALLPFRNVKYQNQAALIHSWVTSEVKFHGFQVQDYVQFNSIWETIKKKDEYRECSASPAPILTERDQDAIFNMSVHFENGQVDRSALADKVIALIGMSEALRKNSIYRMKRYVFIYDCFYSLYII